MRRAVVLAPDLSARGGAERLALTAAQTFRDEGYESVVAAPGSAVDLSDIGRYLQLDLDGIRLVALGGPGPLLARMPNEVRESAEEWGWARRIAGMKPDVLFVALHGSELVPLAPTSYYFVHFPHRLDLEPQGPLRRTYYRAARAVRRTLVSRGQFPAGYTRVLANSEFTVEHVRRRWGVGAEAIYGPSAPLPPAEVARQKVILSVGRFQDYRPGSPHKRQDVLIEAFAAMTDLHADGWQLHLAGSVGSRAELDRIRRLADGLPVTLHPDAPFDRLRTLFSEAEIYWHAQGFGTDPDVLPEAQEHFGITVVEALAAGALPLVHGTGGPVEIVRPVHGLETWTDLDQLRAETRALVRLDATRRGELRVAAARRAQDFTAEALSRRLAAALREDTAESA